MSGDGLVLPPEIWYQILTKLPVKSVLRFRCVCKTWQSLISGPKFISDHRYKRVLVKRFDRITGMYKFSSHDESFVESHEHDDMVGNTNIVGSCDGLICLWKSTECCSGLVQSFLIWNPSIENLVELPSRSASAYDHKVKGSLYGFGFDSTANDHKVLRIHPHGYNGLDCEIYDLRNGVWRRLRTPTLPSYVEKSRTSVYLHGHLHWIGYDLPNCVLLSFNLSIEAFREMEMPCDADFDLSSCFSQVSLINGLLSVAVLRRQLRCDAGQGCSVWSMKEYGVTESWTKLFNVEPPGTLTSGDLFGFRDNGQLLIRDRENSDEDVLALYNPESRESKALLSVHALKDVCFYNETLVLPRRDQAKG